MGAGSSTLPGQNVAVPHDTKHESCVVLPSGSKIVRHGSRMDRLDNSDSYRADKAWHYIDRTSPDRQVSLLMNHCCRFDWSMVVPHLEGLPDLPVEVGVDFALAHHGHELGKIDQSVSVQVHLQWQDTTRWHSRNG